MSELLQGKPVEERSKIHNVKHWLEYIKPTFRIDDGNVYRMIIRLNDGASFEFYTKYYYQNFSGVNYRYYIHDFNSNLRYVNVCILGEMGEVIMKTDININHLQVPIKV